MEAKMEQSDRRMLFSEKQLCTILYGILLVTACIPLMGNWIVSGSDHLIYWLDRIEEVSGGLRGGYSVLFPSAESVLYYNGQTEALDSNLWLLIPAFLRNLGFTITSAYRLFMLLIQGVTLVSAVLLSKELFSDRLTAAFGVLFYMTAPYRIYLCYDGGYLGEAVVWMLLPLFIWGVCGTCRQQYGDLKRWDRRRILALAVSTLSFAGIAYADSMMLLILGAAAVIGGVWFRRWTVLLPLAAGTILFLPGARYFLRYLLKGGYEYLSLPLGSISGGGYAFGQFFASYTYLEGMPGLGLGLFGALLMLLYIYFLKEMPKMSGGCSFALVSSALLLFMSTKLFPWDLLQRVGAPFLRVIGLMGTPRIFFGLASAALCLPAACAMGAVSKQPQKFIRIGIPIMIAVGAIGISIYLCNTISYNHMPWFFQDELL
jgi:hypothetical protein